MLLAHGRRGKLREDRHCTCTSKCFLSVSKTYNERSYECNPNRRTYKAGRPTRRQPSSDHGVPTASTYSVDGAVLSRNVVTPIKVPFICCEAYGDDNEHLGSFFVLICKSQCSILWASYEISEALRNSYQGFSGLSLTFVKARVREFPNCTAAFSCTNRRRKRDDKAMQHLRTHTCRGGGRVRPSTAQSPETSQNFIPFLAKRK